MLVSVVVITYNSSRYVLETLNSVYNQTYSDIELIISDDCSTDDTLTICKEWLSTHQERFIQSTITQTLHNGGICYNYNHALKLFKGEYIKYIAGDDILLEKCIEYFVKNIIPTTYLYFCGSVHKDYELNKSFYCTGKLPNVSASKQMYAMLRYVYITEGPCIFVETKHLKDIGGFDMRFPMIEDYPISMMFLSKGYNIQILNSPMVIWRSYHNSVSQSNSLFTKSIYDAIQFYSFRYCLRYCLVFDLYNYFRSEEHTSE